MKKLFTLAFLAMLGAGSASAQEDVTNDYLVNADLSTVNSGWDYYSDDFKYTDWKTDGDVPVVEFYSQWNPGAPVAITQKDFKFSQTITMPAGDYRIAVNAFYRNGNGDGTNPDKAWIFAGEKKQNVVALTSAGVAAYTGSNDLYKAANAFSRGDFSNAFDFSLEEEQTIEVGFQGFFNTSLSWCILGPVKLYKYSLEDYLVDYRVKVAEAEALYTRPMNGEVLTALKAAVVEESTFSLGAQVQAAIAALNAAISTANNSIAAYAKFFDAYETATAEIAAAIENGAPTSNETLLDSYYAAYEERTLADADVDSIIEEMDSLLIDVVKQQTKAGADMTRLLVNPDFEKSPMGEYGNTYGWTAEPFANGNISDGNVRTGGSTGNVCYEAWCSTGFDVYQVVEEAPYGVYEIEVQGFYRYGRGEFAWNAYTAQQVEYVKTAGVPVYVYMNNNATPFANVFAEPVPYGTLYSNSVADDTYVDPNMQYWYPNQMNSSAEAFSAGMYKKSAFGLVAREGDVMRLGVKGISNQVGDSWVIWDNFHLTYRGFDPVVIKPVLEAAAEDIDTLYIGLLMGKAEYAALTTALADAKTAIENNDGEAMFNALNALYDAKDPARISKDIFLEQEVAADTLRLAEAIRAIEGMKLANSTKAAADELLNGLQNNTIYENDQIDQLKQDVTDMIDRLNNSVNLYSQLYGVVADLNSIIAEAEAMEYMDKELVAEAKTLSEDAAGQYNEGTIDDADVPAKIEEINAMIERLRKAIEITTGINTVAADNQQGDTYNVAGQKVNSQRGIVIKNSKKVVVK